MFAGLTLAFGLVLATTLSRPDLTGYAKIFSIGIVALSLVPLVGFAGQISLCQLSFAGIGAVVMAHLGAGGNPVGLVAAVVVCALVGGLVALPALRLSGIYMALATAAFAVFLDRWIFNLPDFSWGPVHIGLFGSGSVDVAPLRFFGHSLDSARSQMVVSVVVFVAVAVAGHGHPLAASSGRRLLAVRDSEAACATFGLNLLGTRLAVFMLSAGIAGLGGAIYATQLSSITPNNFDFFSGLPVFMMVVVGGAGFVGGALFAGIGLYGILPAPGRHLASAGQGPDPHPRPHRHQPGQAAERGSAAVQRRLRRPARRHPGAGRHPRGAGGGLAAASRRRVPGLGHGGGHDRGRRARPRRGPHPGRPSPGGRGPGRRAPDRPRCRSSGWA